MRIQCFVCASPLHPGDCDRDARLHTSYVRAHLDAAPGQQVDLVLVQNGCAFPSLGTRVIRDPIVKRVGYNWLLYDANCDGDYWVFLPADCRIAPEGRAAIQQHAARGKECFALSRDPKVLVCHKGIFDQI